MKDRVLIIGIDGGTWKLLRPLMEEGVMPNLKEAVRSGASGILKSTIPPLTATAWTTFMTGLSPSKHGIIEFNNYDGAYGTYFVTNSSIKQKTIWELASDFGLRVISVNVPLTYPPYPIRGYMITGLLTPDTKRFTYPPSLGKEILEEFGEYRILTTGKVFLLHGLDRFVEELKETVRGRAEVAAYLLLTKEWDLAMVHFYSSDMVQHFTYHCLEPSHPLHDPSCRGKVLEVYREIDKAITKVLEAAEKKGLSLKVFLSDHGFTGVHTTIVLNSLLLKNGWLKPKVQSLPRKVLWKTLRFARRLDVFNLNRWFLKEKTREKLISSLQVGNIDFSSSVAFSINGWVYGNVFINLKGRQPEGVVEEKDYERIRQEIKEALEKEKGIKKVLTREEAYGKTQLPSIPDLVAVPEDGYAFSFSLFADRKRVYLKNRIRTDHTGSHHIDGIWILNGKGVREGVEVNAEIKDLLPTVFWYMGLDIPAYVDGRVVKEAFKDGFSSSKEEKRVDLDPSRELSKTYDEEGALEERLHDLGYL